MKPDLYSRAWAGGHEWTGVDMHPISPFAQTLELRCPRACLPRAMVGIRVRWCFIVYSVSHALFKACRACRIAAVTPYQRDPPLSANWSPEPSLSLLCDLHVTCVYCPSSMVLRGWAPRGLPSIVSHLSTWLSPPLNTHMSAPHLTPLLLFYYGLLWILHCY